MLRDRSARGHPTHMVSRPPDSQDSKAVDSLATSEERSNAPDVEALRSTIFGSLWR